MNEKNMADVADKAVDKIAGGIEAIAKAVEKVAPHTWEVMVRQQIAEGIVSLSYVALAWLLVFVGYRLIRRYTRKEGIDWSGPNPGSLGIMALGIFACVTLIATFGEAPEATRKFINPEYYAAKELLSAVK